MDNNSNTSVSTTTSEPRQLISDFSKGIFGTSDNFNLAASMSRALSESTIVPKEYQKNPSNCLIAIEQAQRLHVSPLMVMQNLYVIQGRPSWSSKFLIAAINASGKFDQPLKFKEEQKNGKPWACTAWTTLNGEIIEGMTVDMDIAKAEGWLDKNGSKWKTMPQLMLRYRAASFFSSLNCPEVTMGIYTQEEVEDMPEESVADVIAREVNTAQEKAATGFIAVAEPEGEVNPIMEENKAVSEGEQMAMPGF